MLRQSLKLWIWPGVSEDLGVPGCDDASTFPLERSCDDRRPAAPAAGARDLVNKVDQLIGESDCNLPCHPIMLPYWYHRWREWGGIAARAWTRFILWGRLLGSDPYAARGKASAASRSGYLSSGPYPAIAAQRGWPDPRPVPRRSAASTGRTPRALLLFARSGNVRSYALSRARGLCNPRRCRARRSVASD